MFCAVPSTSLALKIVVITSKIIVQELAKVPVAKDSSVGSSMTK